MSNDLSPSRNHWETVWATSTVERHVHTHLQAAIRSVVSLQNACVLEIGCGSGVDSIAMAKEGAKSFAMDYSLQALNHARCHVQAHSVQMQLVAGDIFAMPFLDNSFDVVFSQGLMEHFTDPLPALREQVRILKPGGILCVDVPQTWSLATLHKKWHMRRGTWFAGWETNYSLSELRNLLKSVNTEIVGDYGWMYFPSFAHGVRNLHTLDERYKLPIWLPTSAKSGIEHLWQWLEKQPWYYRWLACIGVVARKPV